jgi:hypothetical protein
MNYPLISSRLEILLGSFIVITLGSVGCGDYSGLVKRTSLLGYFCEKTLVIKWAGKLYTPLILFLMLLVNFELTNHIKKRMHGVCFSGWAV